MEPTDADLRRRRAEAARRYQPDQVELLLVAEAPPSAPDRHFYFEDVREQDSLFRYVARGILKREPTRQNKPQLLGELRDRGGSGRLAGEVPRLIERIRALAPRKIILIKATVYDTAFGTLHEAGLPVVDVRVPFPGSGQQRQFEHTFEEALRSSGALRLEARGRD